MGSGELSYSECKNCVKSELFMSDPSSLTEGTIDFKYKFTLNNSYLPYSTTEVNGEGVCNYEIEDELYECIPGDPECPELPSNDPLNVEFRTVDVNDPFPGQEGSGRAVGFNWIGYDFEKASSSINNQEQSKSVNDELYEKGFYTKFGYFDKSKDCGTLTILTILTEAQCEFLKNNTIFDEYNYIDYYIKSSPNSYGRDWSGNSVDPKYKIVLTPSDIKQIREYNDKTTYDDYISTCEGADDVYIGDDVCKRQSKFVENLKDHTLDITGYHSESLSHSLEVH